MDDIRIPAPLTSPIRKAENFNAFCLARRNGLSVTASARSAGVSRPTGTRYEAQRRKNENAREADSRRAVSVISRTELAERLSELVRSDAIDPRDRINAGKAVADVLGHNAPTRSQVEVRTIPVSVSAWLDGLDCIDVTPEPATLPVGEQRALADGAGGSPSANAIDAVQSPSKYLPPAEKGVAS